MGGIKDGRSDALGIAYAGMIKQTGEKKWV
jgi:hypothetical protein